MPDLFLTYKQKKLAYAYMRLRARGIDIENAFQGGEKVFIYGCGILGRALYRDICNKVHVNGFIDTHIKQAEFEGKHIYTAEEIRISRDNCLERDTLVIVTPSWDFVLVEMNLRKLSKKWRIIPLEAVLAAASYNYMHSCIVPELPLHNSLLLYPSYGEAWRLHSVCAVSSIYPLLLYLLYSRDWHGTYFVFCGNFPNKIVSNMLRRGFFCDTALSMYNPAFIEDVYDGIEFKERIDLLAKYTARYHVPIYGHDHVDAFSAFYKQDFTVLEDGTANYLENDRWIVQFEDGSYYQSIGYDASVRKIILTGILPIPPDIQDKVEIVDLKTLWRRKKDEERQLLLKIFDFPMDIINGLGDRSIEFLLLTENYSAAGYISEDRQLEIYKEIIERYDCKRLVIKPHPADMLDYGGVFPDIPVLPKEFPVEMLRFMGISPKVLISVYPCTPLYNFFADIRIDTYEKVYGNEFNIDYVIPGIEQK